MVLPVGEDLVAEHCAHWVVPNVVRHSNSPSEQLHSQVLVVAHIEQHPVLLLRGKGDRDIGLGLHIERLEFNVGDVV